MQPRPRAETSKLPFPSLRFCICCSFEKHKASSGLVSMRIDCRRLLCLPVSVKFLPDSTTVVGRGSLFVGPEAAELGKCFHRGRRQCGVIDSITTDERRATNDERRTNNDKRPTHVLAYCS